MKKLFAMLLAITMMATLSVTAFAADYDTAGDKGMNVTYSVAPAYTVTIPRNRHHWCRRHGKDRFRRGRCCQQGAVRFCYPRRG